MEIFTSKSAITEFIIQLKHENKTIGFVPTMGALHKGHLSLIEIAAQLTDVVICSIFVNPTQFTDVKDLEKYPRPIKSDIALLESAKCNFLFMPEVSDMYTQGESWNIDLGYLENILEGKFRPGHYQGVTQIVKKLLDVVGPHLMFMGQKDFQQVLVLEKMINKLKLPVEVVMCPIVREANGLALSSRNVHLSTHESEQAGVLSQVLFQTKANFPQHDIEMLKQQAWRILNNTEGLIPEYFEICNALTLLPAQSTDEESIVALVAARVGKTRLIDNIILK
ncbi:MAG: pantoate--beta-alanine ligase [Pyrinomonadaceae bacterium]|nr:pantoate--beta-alanine ligase [Sphingobacteriaceae bacterium]